MELVEELEKLRGMGMGALKILICGMKRELLTHPLLEGVKVVHQNDVFLYFVCII